MSNWQAKLGELLAGERQRQELDLADISAELKIAQEHLQQIEEGQAKDLPAEVYFGLFARSYATHLGIDFDRTVEAIKAETGELNQPERPDPKEDPAASLTARQKAGLAVSGANDSRGRGGMIVVILLVVLIGGFAIISLLQRGDNETSEDRTESTETTTPTTVQPTEQPSGTPVAARDTGLALPSEAIPSPMRLGLQASDSSWAQVVADADTVINGFLRIDRAYELRADERFLITIGRPEVVIATINDTLANLRNPRSQRIYQVAVERDNYRVFFAANRDPNQREETPTPPVTGMPPNERLGDVPTGEVTSP